jgi:thiamine-phosphate pyrophosphorylase
MHTLPSRLYVICDADACEQAGWALVDFARACLDGGARLLQVRAKRWESGPFLEAADAIVTLGEGKAKVIVNDRADVARLSGAWGVHVGQDDLAPRDIRRIVHDDCVVGLSTHTPAQLERAIREPVSHVAIGPVFGTSTKATGYEPLGLERVGVAASVAGERGLPLVAIGGITLDRAVDVIRHGASAVAVIGDLLTTGDPQRRVREYLDRLPPIDARVA